MYILAIETTGPFGSVALINEQKEIKAHRVSEDTMSHLKDLMPMIRDMLEAEGIEGRELAAIACDAGPGSFTGIRIGVSTARALAQIWKIPTVRVSSLTSVLEKETEDVDGEKPLRVMIHNARRRQVYGFMEDYLKAGPWMIDDVLRVTKEEIGSSRPVIFFGDGVDAYSKIITEELEGSGVRYSFAPEGQRYQDASDIARAGLESFLKGETLDFKELLPDYMREAEAEQKLKAGELPISRLPKQE